MEALTPGSLGGAQALAEVPSRGISNRRPCMAWNRSCRPKQTGGQVGGTSQPLEIGWEQVKSAALGETTLDSAFQRKAAPATKGGEEPLVGRTAQHRRESLLGAWVRSAATSKDVRTSLRMGRRGAICRIGCLGTFVPTISSASLPPAGSQLRRRLARLNRRAYLPAFWETYSATALASAPARRPAGIAPGALSIAFTT